MPSSEHQHPQQPLDDIEKQNSSSTTTGGAPSPEDESRPIVQHAAQTATQTSTDDDKAPPSTDHGADTTTTTTDAAMTKSTPAAAAPAPAAASEKPAAAAPARPAPPPNGGVQAWCSVWACFFGYLSSIGWMSAFGPWQEYYTLKYAPDGYTSSDVAWIGSIQLGLFYGMAPIGVIVNDRLGPKVGPRRWNSLPACAYI